MPLAKVKRDGVGRACHRKAPGKMRVRGIPAACRDRPLLFLATFAQGTAFGSVVAIGNLTSITSGELAVARIVRRAEAG